jgi:hypothetical protein
MTAFCFGVYIVYGLQPLKLMHIFSRRLSVPSANILAFALFTRKVIDYRRSVLHLLTFKNSNAFSSCYCTSDFETMLANKYLIFLGNKKENICKTLLKYKYTQRMKIRKENFMVFLQKFSYNFTVLTPDV